MISTDFLMTALIVVLIPGTGVIFTVSSGLLFGRKASLVAALGCTAGIIPHLLASSLGLAALLHASAVLFQAVKFAGVLYLFYLAWTLWHDTGTFQLPGKAAHLAGRGLFVKAVLINILNPKLSIFFLAFLPQFITPGHYSALMQMLTLSGLFMLMTLVVFAAYGLLADRFRVHVVESNRVQHWLKKGFAGIFLLLGVDLALADR